MSAKFSNRVRSYTNADFDRFAIYKPCRELFRPTECAEGLPCWVIDGPPAFETFRDGHNGRCAGCFGKIVDQRRARGGLPVFYLSYASRTGQS